MRPLQVVWGFICLFLSLASSSIGERSGRLTTSRANQIRGEALRRTLESLGGLFIKFGQILSMRPDLVAPEVCEQLSKLLDDVPAEPHEISLQTIAQQLAPRAIAECFSEIAVEPIAAASFATVYRARTSSGEHVALKVQRTSVEETLSQDLRLLRWIAAVVDFLALFDRLSLGSFVEDFAKWTNEELDYLREAAQIERMSMLAQNVDFVRIPKVFWELSGRRLLALELFEGRWLSDITEESADLNRALVASRIFEFQLLQAFEFGVFHADPHAGNICIFQDDSIGIIDFGIVGVCHPAFQRNQLQLLSSIQDRDTERALGAILKILVTLPDSDIRGFSERFQSNVSEWLLLQSRLDLTASQRSGSALLLSNFSAARDCGLSFDATAARYYRSLIVTDSVVSNLYPSFDHVGALSAYASSRLRRQFIDRTREVFSDPSGSALGSLVRIGDFLHRVDQAVSRFAGSDLLEGAFNRAYARLATLLRWLSRGAVAAGALICALGLIDIAETPHFLTDISGKVLASVGGFSSGVISALGAYLLLSWLSRYFWVNAHRA